MGSAGALSVMACSRITRGNGPRACGATNTLTSSPPGSRSSFEGSPAALTPTRPPNGSWTGCGSRPRPVRSTPATSQSKAPPWISRPGRAMAGHSVAGHAHRRPARRDDRPPRGPGGPDPRPAPFPEPEGTQAKNRSPDGRGCRTSAGDPAGLPSPALFPGGKNRPAMRQGSPLRDMEKGLQTSGN